MTALGEKESEEEEVEVGEEGAERTTNGDSRWLKLNLLSQIFV